MFKKILIATDGSENATRGVRAGRDIAAAMSAKVVLMSAAYVPAMYADDLRPEIYDAVREDGRRILKLAEGEFAGSEVEVEKKLVFDEKAENAVLSMLDGGDFDLVIVGSRGLDATERKALGSTSMRVLEAATCPVLIVH